MSISRLRTRTVVVALAGVAALVVTVAFIARQPRSISVHYLGMREWPDGQVHPLFVITNPLPCRITWTMLAQEFEWPSGWSRTEPPKVRFGGETLEPRASFEIYGAVATNVAYRYPVLWGMHPEDALRRPKWKREVDEWCDRLGLRPMFLPFGILRSPVVPPKVPNQSPNRTAAGRSV